ncbi:type I-C CRISPR-associated protein Cas8c/Csd1 [Brotaphodocola sp.]|uniref:type I-C CRISPR-associated protein Cas8c/Csd1 n=1 Tax=Brotaphodocola sp. TaxID=3073577 RepID=UPI003D7D25C1
MNWVQELLEVYEKNKKEIGVVRVRGAMQYVLLPPFHTTVTAQITVTIDQNGNFLSADFVNKEDKMTIIPVTEKSGSRTAGKEPHPLCDNLRYLAGDYPEYIEDDGVCYELYIAQLEKWYQSSFCHEKVKAIYLYLKKKMLIHDLINAGKIKLNENGKIDEKETIQNIPQAKAFVRFIVRSSSFKWDESEPDECWRDRSLQECYIAYTRSQDKDPGLCYLSGNVETISYLHAKKIRNEGDGAKLISANDSQNFTYRGRFVEKEEAFAVGSETSQKIHNALKWIIRRQGNVFDTLVLVTWEAGRKEENESREMPEWDVGTDEIASEFDMNWYFKSLSDEKWDGKQLTAQMFGEALDGYRKKVENTAHMILLGFDASTPGRLAMVEEKELDSARYLRNIQKWHEECAWYHEKQKNGEIKYFWGMVGVRDFADILFGVESNGYLTIVDANSKKLYAQVAKRLIPCIWDAQKIPYDFVNRAVAKASMPLSYNSRKNWERVLTLACSLVKKHRKDQGYKEEWKMAVDQECKERDYLYGRLLAVADRIEYRTYEKQQDDSRVTNAKRYMNVFSQRPYETWKVIEENIQPYLNKLPMIQEKRYYENLLNEICSQFTVEDYKNNERLSGLYLLGYHCQSYDLKNHKEKNTEENKEE